VRGGKTVKAEADAKVDFGCGKIGR